MERDEYITLDELNRKAKYAKLNNNVQIVKRKTNTIFHKTGGILGSAMHHTGSFVMSVGRGAKTYLQSPQGQQFMANAGRRASNASDYYFGSKKRKK